MRTATVVIIGGGPSGSMLAHYLCESGVDSIVIEQGAHFRDKTCAGALPIGLNDLLPEPLRKFSKTEYLSLSVNYRGISIAQQFSKSPFMYGVERKYFDEFLRSDIDVRYSEKFLGFDETKNGIITKTDKESYFSKFLVGADGVGSSVKRVANIVSKQYFIIGEETESNNPLKSDSTARIFLGFNKMGYGWAFPKGDKISVGSGAVKRSFKKGTLLKFAKTSDTKANIFPISIWQKAESITKGRVALVGEAASLVDPFTAAGIYSGIASARILSRVINKSLLNGNALLEGYNDEMEKSMYQEFEYARLLSSIFYPFLWLTKGLIVKESTLDMLIEEAETGNLSYKSVYERVTNSKHLQLRLALLFLKLIKRI